MGCCIWEFPEKWSEPHKRETNEAVGAQAALSTRRLSDGRPAQAPRVSRDVPATGRASKDDWMEARL